MTVSDKQQEKFILESWQKNTRPWIKAINQGQISSRVTTTDQAIISAIESLSLKERQILDIGCGEGWLSGALQQRHYLVTGIDAISTLIKEAKLNHNADFKVLSYQQLSPELFSMPFNLAVANFSLLGKESVEHLFKVLPGIIVNGGYFVIQTLHPINTEVTEDGWQQGSWQGFSEEFTNPAPWYFRTIDSWLTLFKQNNFSEVDILEPKLKKSLKPASIIFIGKLNSG